MAANWSTRPVVPSDADEDECITCDQQNTPFGCCVACSEGWVCSATVSLRYGDNGAEKLSAELEQRATTEAEMLVAADGSICAERFGLLMCTFDKDFVKRVLSRTPFQAQLELAPTFWDADAMNTALLLEDFREMRQWQVAAQTVRSIFPFRLHSVFEERATFDAERLVGRKFKDSHPHLQPHNMIDKGMMANRAEFRALLRSQSFGILEGLPFHPNKLILSGSCMPLCMRRLTPAQRRLCHAEAEATRVEAQLHKQLARRVGATPAAIILWAAVGIADKGYTRTKSKRNDDSANLTGTGMLRQTIHNELIGEAWEDADIDLFVIGEDAEDTIQQTLQLLTQNIDVVTGLRGSTVLRTKNTLTVVGGWPLPHVQVVCKTVRSTQELLVHADVDCTALAYDGERVWAAPRGLRALLTGYNFIPKQVIDGKGLRSGRSAARFGKYVQRGFGILVFEHCRHLPRCDSNVPAGTLEKIRDKPTPKEPRNLKGGPKGKGDALAKWMHKRSPQLRRKLLVKSGADEQGEGPERSASTANDDGSGILAHRLVPGDQDRMPETGMRNGNGNGEERGTGSRGCPMSRYFQFMDLVIPRGPGICHATVREYVRSLGRPDLLEAVIGSEFTVAPKTSSDRAQWQDRARGKCYMCKVALRTKELWPICTECARFNKGKREEPVDCGGMVAVVTGGRTKIGRECALRLLRAGATVIVTSRFPRCMAERYGKEEDFMAFRGRLHVYGADFRRLQSVQRVVEMVLQRFDKIDILIHNAAQTIRRPPAYYETLVRREEELGRLLDGDAESEKPAPPCDVDFVSKALALLPVEAHAGVPVLPSDEEAETMKAAWFPPGMTDAHGEQLDLRTITSWTQQLEDTEMPELVEVLAVNLVVPYLLTARWLPLLRKAPFGFVVFVTSQEGSFSTPNGIKSSTHPHTNVAKAGLNMLAKTIAGELRQGSIFTSAVDPGWVSWMKPGGSQAVEEAPLTEADGAARVLDPIISGMKAVRANRTPPVGVLFKDFRVSAW